MVENILLLQIGDGRKAQQEGIRSRAKESGFGLDILELDKEKDFVNQIESWISNNKKPIATLRWDEHGNVFGKNEIFKKIATWGWLQKIAPLNVDFGYFSHYGSFMFDLLDEHGRHSIKREWASLDDDLIPMEDFGGKLGDYISLVRRIYEKHQYFNSMKHLTPSYDFAIFSQCLANNCNLMRSNDALSWLTNMRLAFGSSAVFKIQPSMFNDKNIDLTNFRVIWSGGNPKILNQPIEQNASIAVPAGACITNNSGVTSEFIVGKKQVITTGESWFSGLGVFHEASDWNSLNSLAKKHCHAPISSEQTYRRLKFVNWWRKHQVMEGEESSILLDLIKEFKEKS